MSRLYIDAVFADGLARGIENWEPQEALQYLRRHVEEPVEDGAPYGREGMEAFIRYGYVPVERIGKSVSRTLDYAYGDWCIAQIAEYAGDRELSRSCGLRSGAWRNLLCPETGFFRGRHQDGKWLDAFNPLTWGGPYVEGSAWQFAWHVPHQPNELIEARGGKYSARAFLQQLLDEPPKYLVGTYGRAIHEMREMAAVDFGQYAHSNQPSHFTLPYLAHCGDIAAWKHWSHRVCTELYRANPDGLCGDEDNGEMASWWLLMALGLFPDCPGRGNWLLGRPLFTHAILNVTGSPILELKTKDNGVSPGIECWSKSDNCEYRVGSHIPHKVITRGGFWSIATPS